MKTEYDWWAALGYVVNGTVLGFCAALFLTLVVILGVIIALTILMPMLGCLS